MAWVLLVVWTLLTAPLGFSLAVAGGCDPDDFICIDLRPIGGGLLAAWIIGAALILGVASARSQRRPKASGPCPQCGRAVAAGSPTCLNCGYNLIAGR